jgi:hypothetical protein
VPKPSFRPLSEIELKLEVVGVQQAVDALYHPAVNAMHGPPRSEKGIAFRAA